MKRTPASIFSALRNSYIARFPGRVVHFGFIRIGKLLIHVKMPWAALGVLQPAFFFLPNSNYVPKLMAQAYRDMGKLDTADKLEAKRLSILMKEAIKSRKYYQILRLMALAERTTRAMPFKAGDMIARKIRNDKVRDRIRVKAEKVLLEFPDSVYLLHLSTLIQAMNGDSTGASATLMDRLKTQAGDGGMLDDRRFRMIRDTWRAIDMVARNRMEWLHGGEEYEASQDKSAAKAGQDDPANDSDTRITAVEPDDDALRDVLGFREHALQGRMRDEYLQSCDADFQAADTFKEKLKFVRDMLRVGIRHIPDYGPSYDLSRTRLLELTPQIEELLVKRAKDITSREVRDITVLTGLADKLGLDDYLRRSANRLLVLSASPRCAPAMWPALPVLAAIEDYHSYAIDIVEQIRPRTPNHDADIRDFLRWATLTGNYIEANEMVANLSRAKRRGIGMLQYVNILQRQGKFAAALKVAKTVHGQLMSNPSLINAYTGFTMFKRIGELEFLVQTAKIYSEVPQPTSPKGVILIAPRNIDHLRRYPILVLREMKKRGWAVLPLVEGVLPKEVTGIAELDLLNQCIRPTASLTSEADNSIPDIDDFFFDKTQGELKWRGMELSHPMWEDAAINRRRYSIDYSCPRLQEYLSGLASWTQTMGRVLEYAHKLHLENGLPFACNSLVNSRLPDALFRFYCEEFGSPDGFYFLHAANGYQNYFTNFSTKISRRFVLRNMTKSPETRSASFPIPENYERYYMARRHDAANILSQFESVTKVKRSTAGRKNRSTEAESAIEKIKEWRAKGGKVVCAFGKVVCDSGVPFDGGTSHSSMKDWINHSIASVRDSDTLLLIKPHPHELNDRIATFPTEYFQDLLEEPLSDNVMLLGHHWFDIHDMKDLLDVGLIYNGTTAIELGIMGIPCLLSGHFSAYDYPIGHKVPETREAYARYLRFEDTFEVDDDLQARAAIWLEYMASQDFTQDYRFHARPVTNEVVYPPWWIEEDIETLNSAASIPSVEILADRAMNLVSELGGDTKLSRL